MARILFCTTSYPPEARGGAERQAKLQAEELVRRGHRVTVVCHAFGRRRCTMINGVRIVRLPGAEGSRLPTLTYGLVLAAYLATQIRYFDIVHVHLASFHVHIAAFFAMIFRRPLYLKLGTGGERGDIAWLQPRARFTRLFGLRRANRIQAISREIFDEAVGLGIAQDKVLRIANGYDQATFRPFEGSKERLRQELDLPEDRTIVLFTGRFIVQKGLIDLLEVWPAVTREAVLVLVGAAPSREYAVQGLKPTEDVIVRGWTEEIEDYLHAADIFVLPSYSEGMSNSLIEAMACGLAVISTRVGAAEEMIEDGRSGLIVAPGDRAGLAEALNRLIASPELRASMGRLAAETTAARYSISGVADAIEAAYGDLRS
ncbi:MAG: glycosyltransferase [Dehalococcoidia bacterium]|nr:glycosyltransferase [Dehalococcoidia bacterium]